MARRRLAEWLILAPAALLVAFAFADKWSAVGAGSPLAGWAALDFFRQQAAFSLLLLLGLWLLVRVERAVVATRLVAVALLVQVVTIDLANTEIVAQTGALAPSEITYNMAKAIDRLPLSIGAAELLSLVGLPALMVLAFVYGWRELARDPARRPLARRAGAAALALFFLAAFPPLSPRLELNTARPAYLYHVLEYFKRQTLLRPPRQEFGPEAKLAALPAAGGRRPNLVVVALESVGASATSLHNPELREATPFLASLAGSSWVAERAYAVVPHTSKALVAINCGRTPYPLHPIFESTFGLPAPCLGHLLREQGYATLFFQSPNGKFENRRRLVENLGFDTFISGDLLDKAGFQVANYLGYEDDILLGPSRQWLARRKQPFFAFYLTGATHHPYWSPDRYGLVRFGTESRDHERYLNSVRYLDFFLKNLIGQYREAGIYDDTVFVIVGDHGESFGQHSRLQHNASMYEEVLHVPLLIHAPALLPAGRFGDPFSQLDLMPTLLAALGFELQGESEGIAALGPGRRRESAEAQCWYDYWCAASIDGRYKFIHNFGQKPDELYDLEQDPGERENLAGREKEKAARLRQQVRDRYFRRVGRWEAFFRQKNESFWSTREETLGEPMQMLEMPPGDRRLPR